MAMEITNTQGKTELIEAVFATGDSTSVVAGSDNLSSHD